jgi:C4-dicarboxylate-binding protein DctP
VIVNKKFWDGLPADVRAGLDKAMAEATVFANDIAQKENDDAMAEIRKAGKTQIYTPTAADKKLWIEASKPVHKEMASRVGAKLIEEIYAATGAK